MTLMTLLDDCKTTYTVDIIWDPFTTTMSWWLSADDQEGMVLQYHIRSMIRGGGYLIAIAWKQRET